MSSQFASDKRAIAECDICGFQYKLKELRRIMENHRATSVKACPECWNAEHPQDDLGRYRVEDAQAIRDPRPDFSGYAQSRAVIIPVKPVVVFAKVRDVTVST